jgi:hypothetical protein
MRLTYSIAAKHWMALSLLLLAVLLRPQTAMAQQDNLRRYIACNFGGKLSIEETNENAKPFVRSVNTSHGTKKIDVLHGYSLHIAYAGTPFVNFKAERLDHYDAMKQALVDQLGTMAKGTKDIESKTPGNISFNGFDIFVIDRTKLSGGVQSVYLIFGDDDQTVVTLYILNTPREAPQFSTIEQYRDLSVAFVQAYTGCVARNLEKRERTDSL